MRRLVVDTNCLLASINPRGAYFKLYELFMAKAFEWVVSNEILTEYEEQVTRRYSVGTAQQVHEVLTMASNTYFQEAHYKWQLIEADPDDNKFVDVAVAANADLLITFASIVFSFVRLLFFHPSFLFFLTLTKHETRITTIVQNTRKKVQSSSILCS